MLHLHVWRPLLQSMGIRLTPKSHPLLQSTGILQGLNSLRQSATCGLLLQSIGLSLLHQRPLWFALLSQMPRSCAASTREPSKPLHTWMK